MAPVLGVEVHGPAEAVWDVLVDLRRWPGWGPTVREARLDDGSPRLRAGVTGRVQTPARVWLPFEVTTWHEDGQVRSWAWRVAGVRATTHTVTDLGPGRCRVEMSAPWWAFGYLPVLGVALARIRRLVEG